MKLSRISLAILPLLSLCSVQAAVYSVEEIGEVEQVKSTYAAALNDNGDSVFNGAIRSIQQDIFGNTEIFQYFNFPIRLDLIDFDDEAVQALFTDEQLADVTSGTITNDIMQILLQRNPAAQPIGNALSYLQQGTSVAINPLLRDTNMSRGNSEYLYDINNAGVAVGVATTTFELTSFTPEATTEQPEPVATDFWVPQAGYQLGVVLKDGISTLLQPPYQEFGGGFSGANGVSEDGHIAGYGSIGLPESVQTSLTTACDGKNQPIEVCLYRNTVRSSGASLYQQRAMLWQLQDDGSAAEPLVLGFLGEKNTGETYTDTAVAINYDSYNQANAVNSKGIAVGHSMYSDSDRKFRYQAGVAEAAYRQAHATLFVDGETLPMVDPNEWFVITNAAAFQVASSAVDINENDVAVGYASKVINGNVRSKLFYHDYNSGQTRFVNGFFDSSNTIPSAINDSNQIVGRAEVIIGGTTTRRLHGFVYDIATEQFTDLNSQLSCDSPYTIVDAKDINNNGGILATALVEKERKDLLGNVVLDEQGNPQMEEVAITVKLQPVANGEPETCGGEQTEYERKGGAAGVLSLLFGGIILGWRRRKA
ncbi:DUF3466 family protein [Rheinheimera nanhaiensis]|uniref:DUF3466 family protein n=1 Tax=Rheinheimera nanhaiensis E407-8 TaxID=562729 RepID=I1DYL1_9GAMM|nr:DUF3466 family protein [Rheinheimera nanhaiensis]GAB59139.1 hypothetical protein RNAN_2131 [Rheinheimera nanhaiensis E407-8]